MSNKLKVIVTKKILISFFLMALSSGASAMLIEQTVIKGTIVSYDENFVVIKDKLSQKHKIERKKIEKRFDINSSEPVEVPLKISPKDFNFGNLPYKIKDIKKVKKEFVSQVLISYLIFLHHNDQVMGAKGQYSNSEPEDGTSFNSLINLIMNKAYADSPFTCFWGGWPTNTKSSGSCRAPYSSRNTAVAEGSALRYNSCGGGSSTYRCNPVVFGSATQFSSEGTRLGSPVNATGSSSARVRPTPEGDAAKGICVEVSSVNDIVSTCVEASRHNFQNTVSAIKANPADFNRFASSVERFCRQGARSGNSSCRNLRQRLGAIQLAIRNDNRGEILPETASCTEVEGTGNHGSFGQDIGDRANSCPGSLCYVRANCTQAGSESSTLPVTAVCGCNKLGLADNGTGDSPEGSELLACINDRSIAVLNRAEGTNLRQDTAGGQVLGE